MRGDTPGHIGACAPLLHPFEVNKACFKLLQQELQAIENQATAYRGNDQCPVVVTMEKNQPNTICRFEHIVGSNAFIQGWEAEYLRPRVESIVGKRLCLFKDKLNLKLPGGGAFNCHQDFAAYRHFTPLQYFTAMIAIDPMTEENGCVEFATNFSSVAAQHNLEAHLLTETLLPFSQQPSNYGDILPSVVNAFDWQKKLLSPGEGFVFDGFIPHRSSANTSKQARRTLFITYNPVIYGDHYASYYEKKMETPGDPVFHVSTPTHREEKQA